MRAGRSSVKNTILSNLAKQDSEYPLDLAESSVLDYYIAGTLTGGLQELHQKSAADATSNEVLRIKSIPQTNPVSDSDLKFGTMLRQWIKAQRADPKEAEIKDVFEILKSKKWTSSDASTPLDQLAAIEEVFQRSLTKGSGVTPGLLSEALAQKIK